MPNLRKAKIAIDFKGSCEITHYIWLVDVVQKFHKCLRIFFSANNLTNVKLEIKG